MPTALSLSQTELPQSILSGYPFPTMSISIFLLWLVSMVHAIPDPRGYLLNCGSLEEIEYNGLKYITDEGFVNAGNVSTLEENPGLLPVLTTLRYFPDTTSRKYCYQFQVIKGSKFLVRTTYFYGGFDGGMEPPVFDQIVDGTKWSTVNTSEDYANGLSSYYEIVVAAQAKTLSVCLARNEHTVSSPFISAMELQGLDDSQYNATDFGKYALTTVARTSFGGGDIFSFPDDEFNRFWHPFVDNNPVVLSHSNVTPSSFWNKPPSKAFTTAITTSRGKTLTLRWPPFKLPTSHYYIALYFQDGRTPSPYSWRIFSVGVNGENFYTNLNATTSGVSVYGMEWRLSGQTEIVMTPKSDMPVGPIINAGEIFQILPLGGRTLNRDVVAMGELARSFDNPPSDWNGDPCLPKQHAWTGVSCFEGKNFRVISLNLTSIGLSGTLPKSIVKLTALADLWLGDNTLSGTIPDMSRLKSLESLHLENNRFEGSIPESLGQLPKLREIFLQNNRLDGSIPKSLTNRSDIKFQVSPGNNIAEQV